MTGYYDFVKYSGAEPIWSDCYNRDLISKIEKYEESIE